MSDLISTHELATSLLNEHTSRDQTIQGLIKDVALISYVIDNANAIVTMVDVETKLIVYCNKLAATTWGYDKHEICGKSPTFFHVDGVGAKALQKCLTTDSGLTGKIGYKCIDGIRYFRVAHSICTYNGKETAVGICHEVPSIQTPSS